MEQAERAFMQLRKPVAISQLLITKKGGKRKANNFYPLGSRQKCIWYNPSNGFSEKIERIVRVSCGKKGDQQRIGKRGYEIRRAEENADKRVLRTK